MNLNEDDPKDWEPAPDEVPPDSLQKKWDKEEEIVRPSALVCPTCKSYVPSDSFRCLHCGGQVFKNSGLLGKIMSWIQFWKP